MFCLVHLRGTFYKTPNGSNPYIGYRYNTVRLPLLDSRTGSSSSSLFQKLDLELNTSFHKILLTTPSSSPLDSFPSGHPIDNIIKSMYHYY